MIPWHESNVLGRDMAHPLGHSMAVYLRTKRGYFIGIKLVNIPPWSIWLGIVIPHNTINNQLVIQSVGCDPAHNHQLFMQKMVVSKNRGAPKPSNINHFW